MHCQQTIENPKKKKKKIKIKEVLPALLG